MTIGTANYFHREHITCLHMGEINQPMNLYFLKEHKSGGFQ